MLQPEKAVALAAVVAAQMLRVYKALAARGLAVKDLQAETAFL
jgi:hypothetical protein